MSRGGRAGLLTAAVLTALAVLSACTGSPNDDPTVTPTMAPTSSPTVTASPTPSPSPTLNEEEAAKQENIDAASERYAEYLQVTASVLADPSATGGFEKIRPYIGSEEMVTWWRSIPKQFVDLGYHQTGRATVKSANVTRYEGDPLSDGTQIVHMEACVDGTAIEVVAADGSAATSYTAPTPVIIDVVMQRQPGNRWTVQQDTTRQPFEEC